MVCELATEVQQADRVELGGKALELPAESTYLLLNKPLGVMTTMRDPRGRATVAALIPTDRGIFPVGRLDYSTAGALLLTNDGELAHRLLHPRFGVEKTYRVVITGRLSAESLHRLTHGVTLPEFRAAAAKVRTVALRRDSSVIDVTIHEGRNRQVRRMFEALRHNVLSLTRTRFGPLKLGALAPGQFRAVTSKERAALEQYRRPQGERSRTTSA